MGEGDPRRSAVKHSIPPPLCRGQIPPIINFGWSAAGTCGGDALGAGNGRGPGRSDHADRAAPRASAGRSIKPMPQAEASTVRDRRSRWRAAIAPPSRASVRPGDRPTSGTRGACAGRAGRQASGPSVWRGPCGPPPRPRRSPPQRPARHPRSKKILDRCGLFLRLLERPHVARPHDVSIEENAHHKHTCAWVDPRLHP